MIGWQHQFNAPEFEQNLGNGEGQGSPAYCCPWVAKSQTQLLATEQQHGASSIQQCQQGMADTMTNTAFTVAPTTPVTTQAEISACLDNPPLLFSLRDSQHQTKAEANNMIEERSNSPKFVQ